MTALIIGDGGDSHVAAVAAEMERQGTAPPLVLDAPGLQSRGFSVDLDRVVHDGVSLSLHDGGRGWLRRYAPSAWGTGAVAGSLDAVTKRAFLALIGSITRLGDRSWLTALDAMLAAEDRLVQLEAARHLALRTPETIVTSDAQECIDRFGPRFVVKPLSGGYYWVGNAPRAVFASELNAEEAVGVEFSAAPFVAQEALHVSEHLRVVTVGGEAWVGALTAEDRPLDWRRQEEAHSEWKPATADDACEYALQLADALTVGYSSQDWVRDDNGLAFLDLNPGGQWLFLPPSVAAPATEAIARFLGGATS